MSFNFPFDEMHVIVFTLISLLVGVLVPLTSGRNKTKYVAETNLFVTDEHDSQDLR